MQLEIAVVIIDHWGRWGRCCSHGRAQTVHGGHWHDMDMLLIGANLGSSEPQVTQAAVHHAR